MMKPNLNPDDEAVVRAYREASASQGELQNEPTAAIDDAIRAAARRAVAAKPHAIKKSWRARWATPLAVAASIMLTASLLFVALDEQPDALQSPLSEATPESAKAALHESAPAKPAVPEAPPMLQNLSERQTKMPEEPVSARVSGHLSSKDDAANDATAKLKSSRQTGDNKDKDERSANLPVIANATTAAPAATAMDSVHAERGARKEAGATIGNTASAIASPTAAKMAEVADRLAAPIAAPMASATVSAPPALRGLVSPVAPPPPAAASTPMAPAKRAMETAAPQAAPQVLAKLTTAPRRDQLDQPVLNKPANEMKLEQIKKTVPVEAADAWITRMSELKTQQKSKELREELTRFRKHYPATELPKPLAEEWAKILAE